MGRGAGQEGIRRGGAATGPVTVIVAIVAARLIVPLAIPRYPLIGIVGALLFDAIDESAFRWVRDGHPAGYQPYDKALDIYYLTIAYAATIRNWRGGFVFRVGRALWYYRLVGVTLFEVTGLRWMLFAFANVFEYYFVVIEFIRRNRDPFALTRRQVVGIVAFVWVVLKLPQEWWIHLARLDFTDALKEVVFGVPADAPWLAALAHRPMGVALVAAAAAAVVVVLRLLVHCLPPPIWRPTWSADVQARRLGFRPPPEAAVPVPYVGWPLIEKVVLVSLVTLIFSQMLPGERNSAQVIVGVTLVIAASLIVDAALSRRRITWGSTVAQFLVMAAVNTAVLLVVHTLLATTKTSTPPGVFLFLVGLLTLIIVLFDHFKRVDRVEP